MISTKEILLYQVKRQFHSSQEIRFFQFTSKCKKDQIKNYVFVVIIANLIRIQFRSTFYTKLDLKQTIYQACLTNKNIF